MLGESGCWTGGALLNLWCVSWLLVDCWELAAWELEECGEAVGLVSSWSMSAGEREVVFHVNAFLVEVEGEGIPCCCIGAWRETGSSNSGAAASSCMEAIAMNAMY